jgi:hypothetical protein
MNGDFTARLVSGASTLWRRGVAARVLRLALGGAAWLQTCRAAAAEPASAPRAEWGPKGRHSPQMMSRPPWYTIVIVTSFPTGVW